MSLAPRERAAPELSQWGSSRETAQERRTCGKRSGARNWLAWPLHVPEEPQGSRGVRSNPEAGRGSVPGQRLEGTPSHLGEGQAFCSTQTLIRLDKAHPCCCGGLSALLSVHLNVTLAHKPPPGLTQETTVRMSRAPPPQPGHIATGNERHTNRGAGHTARLSTSPPPPAASSMALPGSPLRFGPAPDKVSCHLSRGPCWVLPAEEPLTS